MKLNKNYFIVFPNSKANKSFTYSDSLENNGSVSIFFKNKALKISFLRFSPAKATLGPMYLRFFSIEGIIICLDETPSVSKTNFPLKLLLLSLQFPILESL